MRRVGLGLVVLTVAALSAPNAMASVHVTWDRPVGAAVSDVAIGPGGAIYVVGQTPPGSRTYDGGRAIVRRMTTAGDAMWTRSWTHRRSHPGVYSTQATAVAVSDRGVVYVVGTVQRFNCEGGGWFVRSYGPNGRFLHMWGTVHAWHCRPPGPQTVMDVATNGSQVVAFAYTGCCGESNRVEGAVRVLTPRLRPLWTANVEPPAPSDRSWFDSAESLGMGADGAIYAAGWAATQPAPPDGAPDPIGSLLVQKISPRGRTLWSRRPGVPMGYRGGVSLALTGSHLVIGARSRGGGLWLGELTQHAVPVWSSTWGADPSVGPTLGGVAVDGAGRIWMTGSQRLPKRHGRAPFVRRYRASGVLIDVETIHLAARWVEATSVATLATTAFVTGTTSVPESGKLLRGHVWRLGT